MIVEIDINILNELIRDTAGKSAEPVSDILRNRDEVNEYKIADKLKITVNQVRNILYKLFDKGIVTFRRKKDNQKGWYIYFWSLNVQKALTKFIELKQKEIEDLRKQIDSLETKHYYSCPYGCVEVNEENALHYNFICQECGQLLVLSEKADKIKELRNLIEKSERQIVLAKEELVQIEEKVLKNAERTKKRIALKRKKKLLKNKKIKGRQKLKTKNKRKK